MCNVIFTLLTDSSNFTQLKLRKILKTFFQNVTSAEMLFVERNNQDTPTIISIQNGIMHSCLVPVYVQNMVNQRTEGGLLNLNI